MSGLLDTAYDFLGLSTPPPPPPAMLNLDIGMVPMVCVGLLCVGGAAFFVKQRAAGSKPKAKGAAASNKTPTRASQSPAPVRTPAAKPLNSKGGKSTAKSGAKNKKVYLADKNQDGHTTRSEARAANLRISKRDLNDDGRTTRSEARMARMVGLAD